MFFVVVVFLSINKQHLSMNFSFVYTVADGNTNL